MLHRVPTRRIAIIRFPASAGTQGRRELWAIDLDERMVLDGITPIDTASGDVKVANQEFDYELPYIHSRVAGDVVFWFANQKFAGYPPFDTATVIAFDLNTYLEAFQPNATGLPPTVTVAEVSRFASAKLGLLPSHVDVDYCLPVDQNDDCGRTILKQYRDILGAGWIMTPSTDEACRLNAARSQFEIGIRDQHEIVIDMAIVAGTTWYRLIAPSIFPIWIRQSTRP